MSIKFLHDLDVDGELKGTSLDINGAASINGLGTSEVLKIEANSNPFIRWVEGGTNVGFLQFTGGAAYLSNMANGSLIFRTNNTDRVTISSSGDTTFTGDLTVTGDTYGLYHRTVEDGYYFDTFQGDRNLSLFLKNQRADTLRYQQIDNFEYWNGSAWVADASQEDNVKKLLDGRQDTKWNIPQSYYKFRFTTSVSNGWPTRANIGIQTGWSGSTWPGCQMLVEEFSSGSWNTLVTAEFGGVAGGSATALNSNDNSIDNWGLMFKADGALHTGNGTGSDTTRITIDFYGWSPSNASYTVIPLQNIFITSNYAGTENTDYTNLLDYDRNATFAGDITLGANHIGRDSDNYIGFETDNLIKFRVNGASQVKISDGVFAPQTDSDVDLGTNGVRFKNVYADTLYGDGSNLTNLPSQISGLASTTYVDTAVANLVDTAPSNLNTLNELAAALGDDVNFSTTVTNSIATKLPLAGGTMSGAIAMGNNHITGINSIRANGDVSLLTSTGEYSLYGAANAQTALYNNGVKTFETTSTGATVIGSTATFLIEGSGVTSSNLKFRSNTVDRWNVNVPSGLTNLAFTTGSTDVLSLDTSNNATFANNATFGGDIYTKNLKLGNGSTDSSIQLDGDFGGGDLTIQNLGNDQDILFKGNDNGSSITALTLDMSESGTAIFNHDVKLPSSGILDWGSGDARIVEGETNNYSLTFKTYNTSTSSCDAALRLDGDNTATFTGDVTISGGTLNLGNDVSLFDDGTNILRTDDIFHANGNIHVGADGKLFDRADTSNYIELASTINISTNTSITGNLAASGTITADRLHLFTTSTDRATIQAGSSGTTGHLYLNSYQGSDLHQLTWSGANNGFYPQGASGTFSLGLTGNRWSNVYTTALNASGDITVGGTVDGVDIATRDGILTSTTTTANAALPKGGGTMSGAIAMGSNNITGGGTITGTTLTGTSLDINGNADISGYLDIHDEIVSYASGALLRKKNHSWSNATTHDVLYQGWYANIGDYVYLKAPGNSTNAHGTALIGDDVMAFGRSDVETGNIDNNTTRSPLRENWFVLNRYSANFLGSIVQENSFGVATTGAYVPMVNSGLYTTNASSVTGRLRIKLPHYKARHMMSFTIDIYEYNTNRMQSIKVGGYNYNDTNASWYNTSAIALMDSDNRDLTVRFGADTTNGFQCVSIGETNTTWEYPQVVVRDYMGGYNATIAESEMPWEIAFVTSDNLTSYTSTHTNNHPYVRWDKLENKPTTLSGYGITDAATSAQGTKADTAHGWGNHASAGYAASSHNQAWSTITSTPTTISGYGITDAFDGAYGSLSGRPTIPSGNQIIDWTANGAGTIHSGNYSNTQLSNSQVVAAVVASTGISVSDQAQIKTNIGAAYSIAQTLDWTASQTQNIHADNYTNTTYNKASFDLDHLFTLIGASADTSEHMGVYTSQTVPGNRTIKENIEALSTRKENIIVACSDETSDLTTGTGKVTFRMPYAMQITDVRASLTIAANSGLVTVDINLNGSTIFATEEETGHQRLTIDAGERTSTTATTAYNFLNSASLVTFGDDAEISIDLDAVGTETTGKGLKVTLIGYQR